MSQNTSHRQTVLEPSELPTQPSTEPNAYQAGLGELDSFSVSMAENVDRLMDEIFEDVDRMLERGVQIPIEPALTAEPPSPEPVFDPVLPPKLTPRQLVRNDIVPAIESDMSDIDDLDKLTNLDDLDDLADLDKLVAETAIAQNQRQKGGKSMDKLLLAAVLISLAVTGGLWWFFRHQSRAPQAATQASSAPTDPQTKQDDGFLSYVGRSLDRIERTTKANREAALANGGTPGSTSPTVLERVYIPIYQPPQTTAVAPGGIAAPTTAPPTAPSPTAPSAPVATAPTTPTVPNISPSNTHVLIGVLELGDRSAALFEINGTPQRVQVGESIGASGWTLVSISNQEAIVRRNGEVRSIYVGQQF
jgi:cytoskeletal protein RodZ